MRKTLMVQGDTLARFDKIRFLNGWTHDFFICKLLDKWEECVKNE